MVTTFKFRIGTQIYRLYLMLYLGKLLTKLNTAQIHNSYIISSLIYNIIFLVKNLNAIIKFKIIKHFQL